MARKRSDSVQGRCGYVGALPSFLNNNVESWVPYMSEGAPSFWLASIWSSRHCSLLSPVILQPNDRDQPWATAWSLSISCSYFLCSAPDPCPNSSLWFSLAVSGDTHWPWPPPVQFPSICACSGLPGCAYLAWPCFSLCDSSIPYSLISGAEPNVHILDKWHVWWENSYELKSIEIFKTTCQIHWYLLLIFIYWRGMIDDRSSRICS